MKIGACASLAMTPLTGTWYRAIQLKFWNSLLATAHTATVPGRFNAGNALHPGFEILYFAENHLVALFEVQALLGSPHPPATYVPNPSTAWVIINVDIQLSQIADLTRVPQRKIIGTTVQELTGDWRGYSLRNPLPTLSAPIGLTSRRSGSGTDYTESPTWKASYPTLRRWQRTGISLSSRRNCSKGASFGFTIL